MQEGGDGQASNAEVLERIKSAKSKEIKDLTPQLIDIALTKLYNDVSNRKGPKPLTNIGFDLFGGYHGVPKTISLSRGRKKDTSKATFLELDLWIKAHEARHNREKNIEFKRLVEDCRPFQESDDDTLEAAMKRKVETETLKGL